MLKGIKNIINLIFKDEIILDLSLNTIYVTQNEGGNTIMDYEKYCKADKVILITNEGEEVILKNRFG